MVGDEENDMATERNDVLGGAVLAGSAVAVGGGTGVSAAAGPRRTEDEAAIRQLSVNYAIGTDAVAVGDLDRALALYSVTFTADAPIAAGFDRASPALAAVGPVEWSGKVAAAFVPHRATQHLLGTIDVRFDDTSRDRASMTSYLHATHVYKDRQELLTVLGTYIDEVERIKHLGWRITNRFLQFTSFEVTPRLAP